MIVDRSPLEITLEFTCTQGSPAFSEFPWAEKQYWVKSKENGGDWIRIPWHEPWLRQSLERLEGPEPGSEVLERLGRCLRDCLRPTSWVRDEEKIEIALNAQPPRPLHLTIRSNAEELYYLPWELLPQRSGRRLVGLSECLIQYEYPPVHIQELPIPPKSRILLACSDAGGAIPAEEHEAAIRSACEKVGLHFDPRQDVLRELSRRNLVAALNDPDRPVTVLHLLCHGIRVANATYGLTFHSVNSPGRPERLDATQLRDLIFSSPGARSLRLVTLCSCQGGDAGMPANILGSVARMFHQQGVPAVIASRMPFSCLGSVKLTEVLYEGLLAGTSLRTVLCAVRTKLRTELRSRDWLSLQFYARAGDTRALSPFSTSSQVPSEPERTEIPPKPAEEGSHTKMDRGVRIHNGASFKFEHSPLSGSIIAGRDVAIGRKPGGRS